MKILKSKEVNLEIKSKPLFYDKKRFFSLSFFFHFWFSFLKEKRAEIV